MIAVWKKENRDKTRNGSRKFERTVLINQSMLTLPSLFYESSELKILPRSSIYYQFFLFMLPVRAQNEKDHGMQKAALSFDKNTRQSKAVTHSIPTLTRVTSGKVERKCHIRFPFVCLFFVLHFCPLRIRALQKLLQKKGNDAKNKDRSKNKDRKTKRLTYYDEDSNLDYSNQIDNPRNKV